MKLIRSEDDEIALLSVAAPAIASLIERKKALAINKICSDYVNSVDDLRPAVATYIALKDLWREIENKLESRENETRKREGKINE